MSGTISSKGEECVEVIEDFNETRNVSYGIVKRHKLYTSEDASVSRKSSTFTKMEKCLLITTVLQSLMLVVAIICVATTYSKCIRVDQKLKFSSNSNALEIANLSLLESSFRVLEVKTRTKLLEVVRDMNAVITNVCQQINYLNNSHEVLARKVSLLRDELCHCQESFNIAILNTSNVTISRLEHLRKDFEFSILNVTINIETQTNSIKMKIIADIMALHVFNSCEELGKLSLLFPSGIYRVRSYKCSFIHKYCSTNRVASCRGVPGNWRRIAYLNTNENPVSCPDNFEVRDPNSNPPLCRRTNPNKGCSSVTYPSNGMSYSQVCGTVRIHAAGTPDGFITFRDRSMYVDGVYFTHGVSSSRNHIWTYSAATAYGNTRGCSPCYFQKPMNMPGKNYTCITLHCDIINCYQGVLWGNATQLCFGNGTFYRQLSESTTDNIEMRVCRDERRSNEDIFISFVELFVL